MPDPAAHPPRTLLGFDFGTRRIGVAVGQAVTGTARPLVTLDCRDGTPDWTAIGALLDQWQPDALVVGLPLLADGSEGETCEAARRFARRLAGRYHLPVHLQDERLSSAAAEAGGARGHDIDAEAAALILGDWLARPDEGNPPHD